MVKWNDLCEELDDEFFDLCCNHEDSESIIKFIESHDVDIHDCNFMRGMMQANMDTANKTVDKFNVDLKMSNWNLFTYFSCEGDVEKLKYLFDKTNTPLQDFKTHRYNLENKRTREFLGVTEETVSKHYRNI